MQDRDAAVAAAQAEIDKDRDWVIGLTSDMVRIPSVNPKFETRQGLNREADVQALLEPILKADGFSTEQWDALPGRPNLAGEWAGDEERSLILCGHVDVVPVGEMKNWSADPFGANITNGRLYGRGAVDMKGGVAALHRGRACHPQGRHHAPGPAGDPYGGRRGSRRLRRHGRGRQGQARQGGAGRRTDLGRRPAGRGRARMGAGDDPRPQRAFGAALQ
ncbi:hypothetical protein MESS4_660065 [Mesorhizobium sp. STM 4661]|nr:hypothetical protein MESS4_660065 [Mesorhizobium sp. STM 4661]